MSFVSEIGSTDVSPGEVQYESSGRRSAAILWAGLLASIFTQASCSHYADRFPDAVVRVVAFGDSITEGSRFGIHANQNFASLAEDALRSEGLDVGIRNASIGGQTTVDALKRYDADVVRAKPKAVTIMFGSNDSFIDSGRTESRVSLDAYRHNLETMIERAKAAGIRPVLMTPPRWGLRPINGLGENPNPRLEAYVEVCREIAAQRSVPLVDHFADWKAAEEHGQQLRLWLLDGLHPNAEGHQRMAALLLPLLRRELTSAGAP